MFMFMLYVDYSPTLWAVGGSAGDGLVRAKRWRTYECARRTHATYPVVHYGCGGRPRGDVDFYFLQLGAVPEHIR